MFTAGCRFCVRIAAVRATLPGNGRFAGMPSRRRPVVPLQSVPCRAAAVLLLDLPTWLMRLLVCGAFPRRPTGGTAPTNGPHIFWQRARIRGSSECTSCVRAAVATAACSMPLVSISTPPPVRHWRARVSGDSPVNLVKQLVLVLAILRAHPPRSRAEASYERSDQI